MIKDRGNLTKKVLYKKINERVLEILSEEVDDRGFSETSCGKEAKLPDIFIITIEDTQIKLLESSIRHYFLDIQAAFRVKIIKHL